MLEFQQSRISTQTTSSIYSDDLVVGLIIRLKMVKEFDLIDFLVYTHTHTHIYWVLTLLEIFEGKTLVASMVSVLYKWSCLE